MKHTTMNSGKSVPENVSKEGGQPRRSNPTTSNTGMIGEEPLGNVTNDPNTTDDEFNPTRQEEISRSLPIPEYKIGWIIGKRGSYINQVEDLMTDIGRTRSCSIKTSSFSPHLLTFDPYPYSSYITVGRKIWCICFYI